KTAGQNHDMTIGSRCFENVAQFRSTITNRSLIQEEIKRRLNWGNARYHSAQSILSSRLLSKNINIIIYKTIILSLVLYGCETLSLTLREEHRLICIPLLTIHATCPAHLILLPNILLNTLFSNTLSLCSFLNIRDQVSHPYRTICKIIVLYILILMFLDSKREDERLWAES
ncbi:hypothetical protein B7P43_G04158, partial [Cryptotermes secundus]